MITIIPDIHGRVFWKKAVDSMDFKKSNPERVVLLLGNHDWVVFHRVCPEPNPRRNTISVSLPDTPTYNRLIAKNLRNNGETCR